MSSYSGTVVVPSVLPCGMLTTGDDHAVHGCADASHGQAHIRLVIAQQQLSHSTSIVVLKHYYLVVVVVLALGC